MNKWQIVLEENPETGNVRYISQKLVGDLGYVDQGFHSSERNALKAILLAGGR